MSKQPKWFQNTDFFKGKTSRLRDYWRRLMASREKKLSHGAAEISKLITSAHGDNWRRNDKRHR
jgi:hypothetical protein